MAWHVGIDEAGYGPNLGPLLQCAIAFQCDDESPDLWQSLSAVVRRCGERRDSRLLIDDSKKVYATAGKLKALELGVLATLHPQPTTVGELIERFAPGSLVELTSEPWFDTAEPVPVANESECVADHGRRFSEALAAARCSPFRVIGRITPPLLFNTLLDRSNNKAEVLAHGLRWLIHQARHPDDTPVPVCYAIDRQGGRVYHTALLEAACPEGCIEVVEENEWRCVYRMQGVREWRWSFEVEAESRHFTVALASMVSKYLREILMAQFNRFWQRHVPGLKPTAGYPVDAARFLAEIRAAMAQLQIDERLVWRRK